MTATRLVSVEALAAAVHATIPYPSTWPGGDHSKWSQHYAERIFAALPAAPAEAGLRAALLRAVEEVGNAWYDEDGTVIWREELWDRLVILRREYGTIEEAELAALAAQEGAGE